MKQYQDKLTRGEGFQLNGKYNQWFKDVVKKMLAYLEDDRWTFEQLRDKILKDDATILKQLSNLKGMTKDEEKF